MAKRTPERSILERLYVAAALAAAAVVAVTTHDAAAGPGWVALWVAGVAMLTLSVRWPAVPMFVFIALAYGVPRYSQAFVDLMAAGVLNWVAGVGLIGTSLGLRRSGLAGSTPPPAFPSPLVGEAGRGAASPSPLVGEAGRGAASPSPLVGEAGRGAELPSGAATNRAFEDSTARPSPNPSLRGRGAGPSIPSPLEEAGRGAAFPSPLVGEAGRGDAPSQIGESEPHHDHTPRAALIRSPLFWLMAAWGAWVGISVVVSVLHGQPWNPLPKRHPLQYPQAMAMFVVAGWTLRDRRTFWQLALVVNATLCVRGLVMGAANIHGEGDLPPMAVMALPLALAGLRIGEHRAGRLIFIPLAVGLLVILGLSQNRGALVAFVVLLPVLWLVSRYKWRTLAVALPVLVVAGAVFASSGYWQRFANLWAHGDGPGIVNDQGTAEQRLQIWHAGWRMFLDHPVTGVGAGNFHKYVQSYDPKLDDAFVAHNNFVHVLGETGAPGVLLYSAVFAAALLTLAVTARRRGHDWRGAGARMTLAAIAAYLAAGCFISRQDMVLAYLLAGAAIALRHD